LNTLQPIPFESSVTFTIVARVDAGPGAALQNTASATGFRFDPNFSNNSASVTNHVVAESFFTNGLAVGAGNSHTSVVKNDGTVYVWGLGFNGALGDGSSGLGAISPVPVQVSGLSGVQKIEDGNGFVYALKSDGTVWAWGINSSAQLGDGTTTERTRPVQTTGLTNVVGIAGGDFYGAAVKADGSVWVWGNAGLITGTLGTTHFTPVQVAGIQNVTAIAAGSNHLLMLKSDKTVWSVGANANGQLGDGSSTDRTTPVQVGGLSNVARIAAGGEFSLARKEDGTIWAWGNNFNGQLGPGGGSMDFSAHPNAVQVTGLPASMTEIAAGPSFCLAIASDGTIWSWGNNGSRQLGQGNDVSQNPIPGQIPNFTNVAAVSGGNNHSAALKTDGSVWTWGANQQGALGDGTFVNRFAPVRVTGLQVVSSPVINPLGGTFNLGVDVTLTSATAGATIHFTTDGTEPTESDPGIASGGTLRISVNTNLRARAWKAGSIPSSTNGATFFITKPPPQLLLDENGSVPTQLAAVDSVLLLRDPLSVVNPSGNQLKNSNDPNTRVTLFALNLQLTPGQSPNNVQIQLGVAGGGTPAALFAEDVRSIPGVELTQVTFRLPNGLTPGTYQVQLFAFGQVSNVGTIRIKP
jgi:alpha-tubulin suppressor-like RCC1 family protein